LAAWRWAFLIPLHNALICPLMSGPPFRSGLLDYGVKQFVLDICLCVVLSAWLLLAPYVGRARGERSSGGGRIASFWGSWPAGRRAAAASVVLTAIGVVLGAVRYDRELSAYVASHKLYKSGQWDALLERARSSPSTDLRIQFMTNYALYRKRALLDEMFNYPQTWGARGLVFNFTGRSWSPEEDDTRRAMYNSDLFCEMGHINIAFRHAYDYRYAAGQRYDVLKRMAQCSIANGNYDMATKFLNVLQKTLFHKDFARRHKQTIANPDVLAKEFGELEKRLPVDRHDIRMQPVDTFVKLLDAKPDNRMACDYLTAWLLLDKSDASLFTIPTYVEEFRTAGYESLPVHCQEALLLLERQVGETVDLRGFAYDETVRARVDRFFDDWSRYAGRRDTSQRLRALYGETYMFYFFFAAAPSESPEAGGYGEPLRQE
jgi:hypothetical protein